MRKLTMLCFLLLFLPGLTMRMRAQETPNRDTVKPQEAPDHYYRVDFVIEEISAEGKTVNARSYSCTVSTGRSDPTSEIRTGDRIPIVTASAGENQRQDAQVQYIDIGVNISLRNVHELNGKLAAAIHAEVTSLSSNSSPTAPSDPVIRQNHWQSSVLIPLEKPTVVFKSDALDSKGGMQVVVTATPLQ